MNRVLCSSIGFLLVTVVLMTGCDFIGRSDNNGKQPLVTVTEGEVSATNVIKSARLDKKANYYVYNEYTVNLDVNPETKTVNAIEKIKFKNQTGRRLEAVYIVANINAFNKDAKFSPIFSESEKVIYKSTKDYSDLNIKSIFINNNETIFSIKDDINIRVILPDALEPEETIDITIEFESKIPEIAHRIGGNGSMWFGHFIPHISVYGKNGYYLDKHYPAGDPYFADAAIYNVTIKAPINYTIVTTGRGKTIEDEVSTITNVTTKIVRDFSFTVGKYNKKSALTEKGIKINFYYYSNLENKAQEILDFAVKVFNSYEAYVGSSPYSELDLVEADMFSDSAMGYSGLILFDSNAIHNNSILDALALEMAKQWFGGVVGSDPIREAWISEGLSGLITYNKFLYSQSDTQGKIEKLYEQLKEYLNNSDYGVLKSHVNVYKSWNDYTMLQRNKATLMFYALKNEMGEDSFDKFIKRFYADYAFKIADETAIREIVRQVYDGDLTVFFDSWLLNKELPPLKGL